MTQISISEIQRNLHKLDEFDIIEIVDKKRNKTKGYFIDSRFKHLAQELFTKISNENKNLSMRGALKDYADTNRVADEKDAWKKQIIQRYSTNG